MKKALLLFIIGFHFICISQERDCEVFLEKGVILNGICKYNLFEDNFTYRESLEKSMIFIEPKDVLKISINFGTTKIIYVPLKLKDNKEPIFFEQIIFGFVSLYGIEKINYINSNFQTNNANLERYNVNKKYYLKKEADLFPTPVKGFKKTIKEFFSNCSSLNQKIKNKEYNKNNLFEIVEEYNLCFDNKLKKK